MGISTIKVQAGKAGERTVIEVKITTIDGQSSSESLVLTPADIDLIWQATTYTPPFYEGKAMYSNQSDLMIVAIPHIDGDKGEIGPENLIYQWKINGQPEGSLSGYGKNTIVVPASILPKTMDAEVVVSTLSGTVSSHAEISVDPISPKILFYRKHPLQGIVTEHSLVGEFDLSDQEVTLVSVPYFFSPGANTVEYTWSINNKDTPSAQHAKEITFRNVQNESGRSRVDFKAENHDRIMQFTENSLMINYKPVEHSGI